MIYVYLISYYMWFEFKRRNLLDLGFVVLLGYWSVKLGNIGLSFFLNILSYSC